MVPNTRGLAHRGPPELAQQYRARVQNHDALKRRAADWLRRLVSRVASLCRAGTACAQRQIPVRDTRLVTRAHYFRYRSRSTVWKIAVG